MTTSENIERGVRCPICEGDVEMPKLAKLGLSIDELAKIKDYTSDGTIGQRLRIAELAMHRIDPERLSTEYQVNDAIIKLKRFMEDALDKEEERRVQLTEGYEQKGLTTLQGIAAAIGRLEKLWSENQRQHTDINRDLSEIVRKIGGTGIGNVGEIMTITDLKRVSPMDSFDETRALRHGTDIIGRVNENGIICGTITVSVKYTQGWDNDFVDQISRDMKKDGSRAGILVSKAFPREALSEKAIVKRTDDGNSIIVVKPEYAPLAYFGLRQATLAYFQTRQLLERRAQEEDEMEHTFKALIEWINGEEFQQAATYIDCAIREADKTRQLIHQIENYVANKSAEVVKCQDQIAKYLTQTVGLVQRLRELLNGNSSI